jgi:hypothetical protein
VPQARDLLAPVPQLRAELPQHLLRLLQIGEAVRELATQFQALAKQQGTTVALMIGHRLMGMSLLTTGDMAEGRVHLDRASALYDPADHRSLATRFGVDTRVLISA